eukprot:4406382-Amphidinium_carterae.1
MSDVHIFFALRVAQVRDGVSVSAPQLKWPVVEGSSLSSQRQLMEKDPPFNDLQPRVQQQPDYGA